MRRKRKPEKHKVKASKRWKKHAAQISKVQRKVANQRQDWTHKVAAQIVSSNSLVATEKLNLKGMTRKAKKGKHKRQKSGLNRKLLDVAIGMIRESIKYKLDEATGIFMEAPTQQLKSTQRCRECWELTPKTINDRVHVCQHCGHTEDRDVNSAQVCLTWARGQELASLDGKSRSSTDCGSMKQLWAKKRQKPGAPRSSAG